METAYLTTDLPQLERRRFVNNDKRAVLRAILAEKITDDFIKQVQYLHREGNLTPEKITEFFVIPGYDVNKEAELLESVRRIIQHRTESENDNVQPPSVP